eukprot:414741_1
MDKSNWNNTHCQYKLHIHGIFVTLLMITVIKIVFHIHTFINPSWSSYSIWSQMNIQDISHHKPGEKSIFIHLVYRNHIYLPHVCMMLPDAISMDIIYNKYLSQYNGSYISY